VGEFGLRRSARKEVHLVLSERQNSKKGKPVLGISSLNRGVFETVAVALIPNSNGLVEKPEGGTGRERSCNSGAPGRHPEQKGALGTVKTVGVGHPAATFPKVSAFGSRNSEGTSLLNRDQKKKRPAAVRSCTSNRGKWRAQSIKGWPGPRRTGGACHLEERIQPIRPPEQAIFPESYKSGGGSRREKRVNRRITKRWVNNQDGKKSNGGAAIAKSRRCPRRRRNCGKGPGPGGSRAACG